MNKTLRLELEKRIAQKQNYKWVCCVIFIICVFMLTSPLFVGIGVLGIMILIIVYGCLSSSQSKLRLELLR